MARYYLKNLEQTPYRRQCPLLGGERAARGQISMAGEDNTELRSGGNHPGHRQ